MNALAVAALILARTYVALLSPRIPDLALEEKMAIINAGRPVKEDDASIARFRFLLASLVKGTGVDRQKAADMIATGRDTLRTEYGKPVGLLDLTEAVYRAQALLPGTPLAEIVAATVVTMSTR